MIDGFIRESVCLGVWVCVCVFHFKPTANDVMCRCKVSERHTEQWKMIVAEIMMCMQSLKINFQPIDFERK